MKDNKKHETDRKMIIRISRNFILLFIFIQLSDTLFDWFLGLLDLAFDGIHLIIESIEYSIELILENILNTNHQQSEIIIVNVTILIALYLTYLIIRALPRIYLRLIKKLEHSINHQVINWQAMSLTSKIKWITAYSIGSYCLLFLITL
ncbi:MAG: hypothetical protein ACKE51_05640 [Methylococcaceae bacterium]